VNYKVNNEWMLEDLNADQVSHLVWRINNKSYLGKISSPKLNMKEIYQFKNISIYEIFEEFAMTEKAAKIHACKVINYKT